MAKRKKGRPRFRRKLNILAIQLNVAKMIIPKIFQEDEKWKRYYLLRNMSHYPKR